MLSIVIPALNEEQSIERICRRCLEEIPRILDETGHSSEILVVDDGSTDRTAEIVRSIEGIHLHSFPSNRGYGAALMEGFRQGKGELVAFLDADGTCDPSFFVPMIRAVEEGASVALGNRLGKDSRMPTLRRMGNLFFAFLIRLLSGAAVMDSASGMRVLRRECLPLLYPLPEGLHFTPAMSCRAALDPRLTLAEVPMTYAKRQGRSKLGVLRDGVRFLRVILETAIIYRPLLIFGALGALQLLAALLYGIGPLSTFLSTGELPYDRVYRVLSLLVLISGGLGFLYAGSLAENAREFVGPARPPSKFGRLVRKICFGRPFLLAFFSFALALALNAEALLQYLSKGEIHVHWARIALGAVLALVAIQLVVFGLLQGVMALLIQKFRQED